MKYTKELLEPIIKNSRCIKDVITALGLKGAGGNYQTVKNLITEFQFDTTHFHGSLWSKGKTFLSDSRIKSKYTINDILSENSSANNERIKKILLEEKLIEWKCCECDNIGEWNGKPLMLELDHINGINDDNRIENLRLLCPNCHSQTPNFRKKKSSLNE